MQPLSPLRISKPPYFAGIDVGGTNTKIGIVDDEGRTLAYTSIATEQQQGPQGLITRAGTAIRDKMAQLGVAQDALKAAGLGTPGPMDIPNGLILDPTNLPNWRHYPVRDALSKELGLPVAFANDANAAAYGEYWVGGGKQYDSMIMLTLGHGGRRGDYCQRIGDRRCQQFRFGMWPCHRRFAPRCAALCLGRWAWPVGGVRQCQRGCRSSSEAVGRRAHQFLDSEAGIR